MQAQPEPQTPPPIDGAQQAEIIDSRQDQPKYLPMAIDLFRSRNWTISA